MIEQITFKLNEAEYELYMQIENNYIIDAQERFNTVRMYTYSGAYPFTFR